MNKHKGFTYVELIVSAVILALAVAGVFAAFISSAKLTGAMSHDIMSTVSANGYLEQARARYTFSTVGTVSDPDLNTWPLKSEVDSLAATKNITSVDLGSGAKYNFKRVDITVTRDERNI